MQNVKASIIAQRLLNLYRQEHVIIGGWAAVNQVFLAEANEDVINALGELPTGRSLVRHIQNLRSGKTPADSIERELLPYGGAMSEAPAAAPIDSSQSAALESVIMGFTPDPAGLARLMSSPVIEKFGPEWIVAGRSALAGKPELLQKWNTIVQTYRAYHLWDAARDILNTPISDRVRAQLQVDMPEYETYLPMFGEPGNELLGKLRTFVSSIKPAPNQPTSDTPDALESASASAEVL